MLDPVLCTKVRKHFAGRQVRVMLLNSIEEYELDVPNMAHSINVEVLEPISS